jgi:hypothetical protein
MHLTAIDQPSEGSEVPPSPGSDPDAPKRLARHGAWGHS